MRSCLATILLALAAGCAEPNVGQSKGKAVAEVVLKGVRLSLTGPETLPLPVVLRNSPAYDAPRNFFTVSIKNESASMRTLALDELRRSLVLVYRNPATAAEKTDNRTSPPKLGSSVEKLAPGETKSFQVVFEYPADIARMKDHVTLLRFCVKWESAWLRKSAYAPGAYDWNESFELCREIRILEQ